ncbi:MAG TPA: 2OG-Fe(II) oxygenase [Candidatus Binataceae bacterium]|nr:2OG-Fe(II) oxygenase [Candidatus Binataceae bacterium]
MHELATRVAALDWKQIERELDARGYALTARILSPDECAALIALYPERGKFRSRVEMARHRYGQGDYKYFAYPLPREIAALRTALYKRLAPIANRWTRELGIAADYPAGLKSFLAQCHAHGQSRPTPLMLRYDAGGYNCLHQDLYGEIAFPLQFTCTLGERGRDFEGGDLLLVEQRPRAQSRGEAIAAAAGCGVIFANRYRPAQSARGYYRVAVRHGVSTITRGERYALGIIFHDAK